MGENSLHQVTNVSNFELQCFVGSIGSDEAATPSFLNHGEEFGAICVLADRKARSNLPTQPVSPTWLERDTEAPFSVHEPGNVGSELHRQFDQGRRFMKPFGVIQGSQP